MKRPILLSLLLCLLIPIGLNPFQAVRLKAESNAKIDFDYVNKPYQTLPSTFPHIEVLTEADGVDDGYLFVTNFNWRDIPNSKPYLLILDNKGEPIFAKEVNAGNLSIDFKPQPNGQLSYFDREAGHYVILDSSYTEIATVAAGNGYETDLHELILTEEGHAILMIYADRLFDMTTITSEGDPNATVTDLVLQEIDVDGNVIFEWNSADHFEITDATNSITGSVVDYAHGNSIDVDHDGNWIISSRSMDEVTKIDRQTGEIIWRLGGKNNQFTFADESEHFYRQHDARRLENGNLLLFDNGDPLIRPSSRAIEYALDELGMTATAVNIYTQDPATFSGAMGGAQRLPNGNTLVGWGSGYPALTEFKPDGSKAFELAFDTPMVSYRAYRAPWIGQPTQRPELLGRFANGAVELTMSWNGATDVSAYQLYGSNGNDPAEALLIADRTGFETTIRLTEFGTYSRFSVMPLNLEGNPTIMSNQVTVGTERLFMPLLTTDSSERAVQAASDPIGFKRDVIDSTHLFYRGIDDHIYELWESDGAWRMNPLSRDNMAPTAIGSPSAYAWETNGSQHVFYRDDRGQVHELWHTAETGWRYNNLSVISGAVAAESDPFGYVWEGDGSQHVIYRGIDNAIYDLWKGAGETEWRVNNLTQATDAPTAIGHPQAYAWESNGSQHILYRDENNRVHELWYTVEAGWNHKPLSEELNGVPALSDPIGLGIENGERQHVFYRGSDGRLQHYFKDGVIWEAATVNGTVIVGDISATALDLPADATEPIDHLFVTYRGTDNATYQIYFYRSDVDPSPVPDGSFYGYDISYTDTSFASDNTYTDRAGSPKLIQSTTNSIIYRAADGSIRRRYPSSDTGYWVEDDLSFLTPVE